MPDAPPSQGLTNSRKHLGRFSTYQSLRAIFTEIPLTMRLFLLLPWCLVLLSDPACQPAEQQQRPPVVQPPTAMAPALAASLPQAIDSLPADLEKAHQGAICTLDRIIGQYQEKVWSPLDSSGRDPVAAWNEHPDFTRWMGRLGRKDTTAPREFLDLLLRLQRRLIDREIRYVMEDNFLGRCRLRNTRAYVRFGDDPPTIYFCPAWLEQSPGHRIATLVHETVHTLGYGHPRGTDTPLEALDLARNHPAEARVSPENFESLVELYVCLR